MEPRTDYVGIDYGRGLVNIDHEAGIRYGVISMHDVPYWAEKSEAYYPVACQECGYQGDDFTMNEGDKCPVCEHEVEDRDFDMQEASAFFYEKDGYAASQDADDTDIFILKSPYFTYCQLCSPCAPGAGSIENWMAPDKGVKAYCFGHDWFDGNAPYPVYSVATGELVQS